jgi:hypothetical protein
MTFKYGFFLSKVGEMNTLSHTDSSMSIVACQKKPIFHHVIDNLYLGDIVAAETLSYRQKCASIYNISGITYPIGSETTNYRKIDIEDNRNENISQYFEDFVLFAKESSLNTNLLVHCANAVSRSVSLVLYYLMKEKGFNLKESIKFLKSKRPGEITRPNFGFFRQLLKAEKDLGFSTTENRSISDICLFKEFFD